MFDNKMLEFEKDPQMNKKRYFFKLTFKNFLNFLIKNNLENLESK